MVTPLLVFVTVVLATGAIALTVEWLIEWKQRSRIAEQLRTLATGTTGGPTSATILRTADAVDEGWLKPVAGRLPQLRVLKDLLEQGGSRWSVESYILITLGVAAAFGIAAVLVLPSMLAFVVAAGGGALLPYFYVRHKAKQRLAAFEEQLPEAIDLIGRAIRAGHPLSAGLKMVAEEAADPLASEFRRVFEEQRFGMPFEDALLGLTDRVNLTDVRIMVTAILIQRQVGGNLAEVLDNIAYTIRARFTIRRQLRVYTAQGRFSGYVLAVLPIAVGSAIFLITREYIMMLFLDPLARILLIAAVILQILGYIWIRKIINIEI